MRLATFNVENMFERARIMNLPSWDDGRAVLNDFARLTDLIEAQTYSDAAKDEILEILGRNKGLTSGQSKYIQLRESRKRLLRKRKSGAVEVAAAGRSSWIGWFELKKEPVREAAVDNTARVIGLLAADVLCVVEADDRTGLKRFNQDVLPRVDVPGYRHVMLVDGNDERGIDVGILTKAGYDIGTLRSHVDDRDADGVIFSRDCPEFSITTPAGNPLLVLVNHFKSKGYGNAGESAAKRRRQAQRVRDLYDERRAEGHEYIAIVGDLNELPTPGPLDPLLRNGSDLVDVMAHPAYVSDGRDGTYANGTASNKLDYILMSPALAARVTAGGVERRGVWGGKNGTLFPHLPTMKTDKDAASDHAALWIEADI